MAGRVHRHEFDEPNRELVAVAEQPMRVLAVNQPLVLPLRTALFRGIDQHAARGHLPQAREVVGMNVGIGRGDDPQFVAGREFEVAIDVAFRIDDDRLAGSRTANQIRELGELGVGNLSNEHDVLRATAGRWAFAGGPGVPYT